MLLAHISTASTLAPFFLGLSKPRSLSTELKLLLILTGVSFTCDMAAIYHIELKISPNNAGNAYSLAEFILLVTIYYKAFDAPKLARPFLILSLFYVLFFISNLFFLQQEKINSYSLVISSLVFIEFAVSFFYKLMKDLPTLEVYRLPMFWVNVAILVFFAGNLFLFTVSHYLVTTMKNDLMVYWTFHNFLGITENILFTVGFYMSSRPAENPL